MTFDRKDMKTFPIAMVLLLAVGCACRERVVTGAEEPSTDKPPDPRATIAVTARVKDLFPWEFMTAPLNSKCHPRATAGRVPFGGWFVSEGRR